MTLKAPESLDQLRIALVGNRRLTEALAGIVKVEGISPQSSGPSEHHLLLLEAGAESEPPSDEVVDLVRRFQEAGVPCALWIATDWLEPWLAIGMNRFTRVFTVDPAQVPALESAGCPDPLILPTATRSRCDERESPALARRLYPVVWMGGWSEEWPHTWRRRIISLLRAAVPFGLRISGSAEIGGLPGDLQACRLASSVTEEQAMDGARVVIATDRQSPSRHVVPATLFEAIESGAAILSPHDYGVRSVLRGLMPIANDEASAKQGLESLLGSERDRGSLVTHCREIVENNHTYAHRVATIASSLGYPLVPDHEPNPAHS